MHFMGVLGWGVFFFLFFLVVYCSCLVLSALVAYLWVRADDIN